MIRLNDIYIPQTNVTIDTVEKFSGSADSGEN